MAKLTPYYGTPRLEDQHPDVFPGSPAALIAIFVETIRLRFSQDNGFELPFYWTSDPTPTEDEEHTDNSPRKIVIESQYQQHPDSRDFRPAIFVDRGDVVYKKIVVGNRAEYDIPTGKDLHLIHAVTPISIMCVSKDRGESMSIGDIVAMYILGIMPEMREAFGFQDFETPVLATTQVYRRSSSDIEEWVTPVTTQVTCKQLWTAVPIAPLLREISVRLNLGPTTISQVVYGKDNKK